MLSLVVTLFKPTLKFSYQLTFNLLPEKVRKIVHIRPKYACKNCEGLESEDSTVKIAPAPPQIIPKGLPAAGLLAYILTAKFCDALPFYRQQRMFRRRGFDISRQNMSSWAIKTALQCKCLLELLVKEMRAGPLIQVDETTVQVLKEPGRKASTKS